MTSHNCVLHCYHKLLQERAARQEEGQPQNVVPRQSSSPQQQVPSERNRQGDHPYARVSIAPPTVQQVDPPIAQPQQELSHSPPAMRVGPLNPQQVAHVPPHQGESSQQQAKPRVVGQQQARSNVQVSPMIQEEVSHSRAKKSDIVSPPGPSQQKKSQPHARWDLNDIYEKQKRLAIKSEPMRYEVGIRMGEVAQKRYGQRQEKGPPKKLTRYENPLVFEESRKDTLIGLWKHIARNIKRGVYNLKPVKKGQCPTCRRSVSCGLAPHQAICRPEMYTLGCPCGYLCSTIGSLNGHQATCDLYLEKFAFAGGRAFFSIHK
nr:uncharacterized protein LOC108018609 [Drosophila suzukii]